MSEFENKHEGGAPKTDRLDKKMISRVGFALLAVFAIDLALELGAAFIFSRFLPSVYASEYFSVCALVVCNYMIAIPVGMCILSRVIKPWAPREDKRLGAGTLLLSLCASVFVMLLGSYVGGAVNSLIEKALGGASSSGINALVSTVPLWVSFALTVVLGPIMEEVLFRRGVTEALRPWGWRIAVLLSGLMFGVYHGNVEQFFYAAMVGFIFAYVYLYTGKLRYSIILHMLTNFAVGFLPLLISRVSYTAADLQAFVDAANAYSAAAATAATPDAIPAELLTDFIAAMARVLPGMALTMLYNGIVVGLALAGAFVALRFVRKLPFKSAERTIERGRLGDTVFMAPGIILFLITMIAFMLLTAVIV